MLLPSFTRSASLGYACALQVADLRLTLFPGDHQVGDGKTVTPTLREAVECA
jgi:hypothetical protein